MKTKATFAEIIAGRSWDDVPEEECSDPFYWVPPVYDRLKCADGTTLSVQTGRHAYCSPRTNWGPYSSVEVGFPMTAEGEAHIASLAPFSEYAAQDGDTPEFIEEQNRILRKAHRDAVCEEVMKMPWEWSRYGDGWEGDECSPPRNAQVWGYVPVDLVQTFIYEHGGEVE